MPYKQIYSKVLYISCLILLSSCVSKKAVSDMVDTVEQQELKIKQLRDSVAFMQSDTTQYGIRYRSLETAKNYLEEIQNAQREHLTEVNDEKSEELEVSASKVKTREKKFIELQEAINKQTKNSKSLTDRLKTVATSFNKTEMIVSQKGNKVYVTLHESLMFEPGTSTMQSKGRDAIERLAIVLEKSVDYEVIIEGHTDNSALYRAKFEDNWALGSARAIGVSRVLVNSGISPKRLYPTSRGESMPLYPNNNMDKKMLNRRIELIIQPRNDVFQKFQKDFSY